LAAAVSGADGAHRQVAAKGAGLAVFVAGLTVARMS
jgi:hypothetical protein